MTEAQVRTGPSLTAWRFIAVLGVVSLLGDIIHQASRSVSGPLLESLGATAAVVGIVTGVSEAAALALRLVTGPMTNRSGRLWAWAITGYAITAVSVPLLGIAAALPVACGLIIGERVGKAIRNPAKDTMLSHATAVTGRGRGFALHKVLDQTGAVAGPLLVAAILAVTDGGYSIALGVMAIPGIALLGVLWWVRSKVPVPQAYEPAEPSRTSARARMPRVFWTYCVFTAITMTGFTTFGLLSFHMISRDLFPVASIPLVYAAAMVATAMAAVFTGWFYDKCGKVVLVLLPALSALAITLAFGDSVVAVTAGTLIWGAALGVQESTLRAVVADLAPAGQRASAYGYFAAVLGAGAAVGGGLTGLLYDTSLSLLMMTVLTIQAIAVAALLLILRPLWPRPVP